MKTITYQELKKKDVLDVDTGKNLGKVLDVVLLEKNLSTCKLVVPGKKNGFLACERVEIPIENLVKIGDDAILVSFKKRHEPPCEPPCRNPCEEGAGGGLVEFYDDSV